MNSVELQPQHPKERHCSFLDQSPDTRRERDGRKLYNCLEFFRQNRQVDIKDSKYSWVICITACLTYAVAIGSSGTFPVLFVSLCRAFSEQSPNEVPPYSTTNATILNTPRRRQKVEVVAESTESSLINTKLSLIDSFDQAGSCLMSLIVGRLLVKFGIRKVRLSPNPRNFSRIFYEFSKNFLRIFQEFSRNFLKNF